MLGVGKFLRMHSSSSSSHWFVTSIFSGSNAILSLLNKYRELAKKSQNIFLIIEIHFVASKVVRIWCNTLSPTNNLVVKTFLISTFLYGFQFLLRTQNVFHEVVIPV